MGRAGGTLGGERDLLPCGAAAGMGQEPEAGICAEDPPAARGRPAGRDCAVDAGAEEVSRSGGGTLEFAGTPNSDYSDFIYEEPRYLEELWRFAREEAGRVDLARRWRPARALGYGLEAGG